MLLKLLRTRVPKGGGMSEADTVTQAKSKARRNPCVTLPLFH
jgi:hypothetical protein